MNKHEALQVIVYCAIEYEKNLANKNLLFLSTINNRFDYFEAQFIRSNYHHLTGTILNDHMTPRLFYQRCLKNQLSIHDFKIKDDGTTILKLTVLPKLMNIYTNAKMIGDFNGSKPKLYVEKLTGGTAACIGFTKSGNFFVPVTVLKEDMRELVVNQQRVLAILSKSIQDERYNILNYMAKGFIGIEEQKLPTAILEKFDKENIQGLFI